MMMLMMMMIPYPAALWSCVAAAWTASAVKPSSGTKVIIIIIIIIVIIVIITTRLPCGVVILRGGGLDGIGGKTILGHKGHVLEHEGRVALRDVLDLRLKEHLEG
jgi:hypothetical protein